MSPSRFITGVLIRTVRPSSSVRVAGLMSLVGQPCQLPVFLALAGSELTDWSMRRKSGTAPSTFEIATLLLMPPYEQIDGTAHFGVDPNHPDNRGVADITLAARDSTGLVRFAADVTILT